MIFQKTLILITALSFSDFSLARKIKVSPFPVQVCGSHTIVLAEILAVKIDGHSVRQPLDSKNFITDYYSIAQVKVHEVLKGDSKRLNFGVYFRSRSANSPYDYGDKYFTPVKGLKGIWFLFPHARGSEDFNVGNLFGEPLELSKKNEILALLKNCNPKGK